MLKTRVAFKQVTRTENSERLLSGIFPKHNLEIRRRRKHSLTSCSIDHLTDSKSKHRGFSRAGLRLGNGIPAADNRHHCSLLNSRRLLKPVRINTSQQILPNAHSSRRRDSPLRRAPLAPFDYSSVPRSRQPWLISSAQTLALLHQPNTHNN
jgi:hypothetical protein